MYCSRSMREDMTPSRLLMVGLHLLHLSLCVCVYSVEGTVLCSKPLHWLDWYTIITGWLASQPTTIVLLCARIINQLIN